MKRKWALATIFLTIASVGAASSKKDLPEVAQVIELKNLTLDGSKELFRGEHPEIAVLCEPGEDLAVKFFGDFGLFSVKFLPQLSLKIEKRSYLRFVGSRVYWSEDLIHWTKKILGGLPKTETKFDQEALLVEVSMPLIEDSEDSMKDVESPEE